MTRCRWCNPKNPLYVRYHDEEWGKRNLDERYLLEMLILESFQAGLSWECVLNKRENFRKVFDDFDIEKIVSYDEEKMRKLGEDKGIIRNRRKIRAAVDNAKIFRKIGEEYGSFSRYLMSICGKETVYETGKTRSELSDRLSADLYRRGMRFVGTTILYSYLQAIGFLDSHEETCFCCRKVDLPPSE